MARVNRITQFLPATHMTILTLLRKHSPDGTTRTRRHTSDIAYDSIYRLRKDERLSWHSWLTYSGRLTRISGHPSAAGRAWDRKVRRSKTNVLTIVPRNQPTWLHALKLKITCSIACSCFIAWRSLYCCSIIVFNVVHLSNDNNYLHIIRHKS